MFRKKEYNYDNKVYLFHNLNKFSNDLYSYYQLISEEQTGINISKLSRNVNISDIDIPVAMKFADLVALAQ